MNHGYYQDRLSAYFDQALTPEEMQMMNEHLVTCAECRGRLDDLSRLDKLIEDNAALGESDYWEKAAQKIESRLSSTVEGKVTDVRSGWFGLGWKLAAAAASVAALTFVALHEDEIRESSPIPDQPSVVMTAPSPSYNFPSMADTVLGQDGDDVEFEIDERASGVPMSLESAGESAKRQEEPSDVFKALSPAFVPPTSEVAKELEGKATAEVAWQDREKKRAATEEVSSHTVPVTSVDELLESVAGVVTNADGEVFIRGGRAGEVAYIVDSVPIGDPLGGLGEDGANLSPSGTTISVMAERDVIDKYETSHQTTITREPLEDSVQTTADLDKTITVSEMRGKGISDRGRELGILAEQIIEPDSLQSLSEWRTVRDSLQPIIVPSLEMQSMTFQKSKAATDSPAPKTSPSPPAADSIQLPTLNPLKRYLEACFRIAELTDRESEYDSALVVLSDHAENRNSPVRRLARHYLEQLENPEK